MMSVKYIITVICNKSNNGDGGGGGNNSNGNFEYNTTINDH